jgi:hypothetical protein
MVSNVYASEREEKEIIRTRTRIWSARKKQGILDVGRKKEIMKHQEPVSQSF